MSDTVGGKVTGSDAEGLVTVPEGARARVDHSSTRCVQVGLVRKSMLGQRSAQQSCSCCLMFMLLTAERM